MKRPIRSIEIPSIEPTSDGYIGVTTNSAQQFADFLLLIDRPDKLDDDDLSISMSRFKRRDEVHEMTHAYTLQHTTAEVLEKATLLRIPNGPVGNGELTPQFDHFRETGTFVENPRGRFVQPRVPYRISGLEARPFTASPDVGEHDGTIEWGPRDRAPVDLPRGAARATPAVGAEDPRPLSGLRVLDCTAWWAGPAATHMLSCLGADVIKVESVTRPDHMRYTSTKRPPAEQWWEWGPLFHGANNGKRGITLDLARPEGRDLFLRLAETADVLLENFSPRVMEQFDLGWDAVHERNPELVMVRLPAYGLSGPWRDRTGFAQTMEAITGMAWVTGWPDGPPLLPRGACDPLAAMHAVFATMLALHDRAETGEGHLVEVTMIEAALNAAAEQVVEFGAAGTLLGRNGNRGPLAAPQNLYACAGAEEWLALAIGTDEQWVALRKVLDDPAWAADPALETTEGRFAAHDAIDEQLGRWCATHDARELAETLASHGIPAGYVEDARDIAHNPQLVARGFLEVEDHHITGSNRIPMVPFRFAGRGERGWMQCPSPSLGEHNDEILGAELGLSSDELAHLREIAVIGDHPVGA
jgi:crotonobetainyl-CoA:carnitine CoA-transferase CaiB-like acyl-CoA transferase